MKDPKNKTKKKFKNNLCDDKMTFEQCEIAILKDSIERSEYLIASRAASNELVKQFIEIVENFIKRKKLICYGGTAINNLLPHHEQFYNRDVDVPDYDFYSSNAMEDAKELADIYYEAGYEDVEAKAGAHIGTYKVFVNFIPIADITQLNTKIFKALLKESVLKKGIHYAPPNYLRMGMYLELSRPEGEISRWEKVYTRLSLFNKYYPIISDTTTCQPINFEKQKNINDDTHEKLYLLIRDSFIEQGVVFFGGYATSLYSKYMTESEKKITKNISNFDVISDDIDKCAEKIKQDLSDENYKNVKLIRHKNIQDIIPECIEINVGNKTFAYIYKPIACHSYNKYYVNHNELKLATIDTILAFYLSYLYTNDKKYDKNRLICMADLLYKLQQRYRVEYRGILKRFTVKCYGKQETIEEMRAHKAQKYKELSNKKNSREYQEIFLKYMPGYKSDKDINKPKSDTHMNKSKKNTDKEVNTDKEANISKIFDFFNLNELNRNEIGK
jgi:hypothetical protein